MKHLLIAVLLACCQVVSAQIKIELPESVADKSYVTGQIRAAKSELKAYADSLFKAKGNDGGTQNPPNNLPKCDRGPEPREVYNVTTTGATVLWDGENVFGWDYSIYKGTTRVAFGSVKPTSNREPITYAGLEPGEYTISMQGNTCKSDVYSKTFVVPKPTGDNGNGGDGGNNGPPPTSKGKRQIIMNLTGYGFDVTQPTGIHKDWIDRIEAFCNLKYNGKKFRGIDGIRVNMKWRDYEPREGLFRDDKVLDLINYCKARGLRLSIAFIPWRTVGDGMLDESQVQKVLPNRKVWIVEGDLPSTIKTYMPSFHSKIAQAKFKATVSHLASVMAQYPENVDYISTAASSGEEYETVIDHGPNGQIFLTGYGDADLEAWKSYSGNQPVPYPAQHNEEQIANLFSSDLGKKWYEFRTKGLRDFHAAFVQGVREGGQGKVRSLGMYAGVGAPSATWTGLYKLNDIFSAGTSDQPDIIYSSEGDAGSQNSKLMATDLNAGTFPGAALAIEFDPDDISVSQNRNPAPDADVSSDILYYWAAPFFRRGGEDLHFAMSFYAPKVPDQLGPAVYKLRSEFIDSDAGMTGIAQGDHFAFSITRYNGLQEYREMYSQRGGGVNKVVKITLTGNPVGDGGGNPGPQPSKDYSPIKSYVEANLADAYNWNVVFSLRSPSKELYSFEKGGKTKDTRFKVMSHSKFVTGVIISYLIEQGKLSLDTRVGDIIRSWDRPGRAEITLGQIMGHLSGIPDNTDNEGAETLEYYVNELVNKPGFTTPGKRFIYSTSAYQVAARMAELVTGKAWKDLFREILADPCEMGDAEFHPAEGPIPGKPLNPLAGYGLQCSVNQWMNFIGMVRDKGMYKGRRVLSERVFDILKTPTSPGWSDWCVGVMVKEGKYVSEAASGPGTTILEGYYAWTIFTDSSYEKTYWQNIEVRKLVDQIFWGL